MAETHNIIYSFADRRISQILTAENAGAQKAVLANLRKGVGLIPGEDPQIWGTFLKDMPEELYSFSGKPTRAEWSVYTVLTLFALHQQGHDPKKDPMNKAGASLGSAVAKLVHSEDDKERVLRRFNIAATSSDITEIAYHLRTLVQLLRGEGIPLDYPALAKDLYFYQNPDFMSSVRLRWGQDFYRELNTKKTTNNEGDNKNE